MCPKGFLSCIKLMDLIFLFQSLLLLCFTVLNEIFQKFLSFAAFLLIPATLWVSLHKKSPQKEKCFFLLNENVVFFANL